MLGYNFPNLHYNPAIFAIPPQNIRFHHQMSTEKIQRRSSPSEKRTRKRPSQAVNNAPIPFGKVPPAHFYNDLQEKELDRYRVQRQRNRLPHPATHGLPEPPQPNRKMNPEDYLNFHLHPFYPFFSNAPPIPVQQPSQSAVGLPNPPQLSMGTLNQESLRQYTGPLIPPPPPYRATNPHNQYFNAGPQPTESAHIRELQAMVEQQPPLPKPKPSYVSHDGTVNYTQFPEWSHLQLNQLNNPQGSAASSAVSHVDRAEEFINFTRRSSLPQPQSHSATSQPNQSNQQELDKARNHQISKFAPPSIDWASLLQSYNLIQSHQKTDPPSVVWAAPASEHRAQADLQLIPKVSIRGSGATAPPPAEPAKEQGKVRLYEDDSGKVQQLGLSNSDLTSAISLAMAEQCPFDQSILQQNSLMNRRGCLTLGQAAPPKDAPPEQPTECEELPFPQETTSAFIQQLQNLPNLDIARAPVLLNAMGHDYLSKTDVNWASMVKLRAEEQRRSSDQEERQDDKNNLKGMPLLKRQESFCEPPPAKRRFSEETPPVLESIAAPRHLSVITHLASTGKATEESFLSPSHESARIGAASQRSSFNFGFSSEVNVANGERISPISSASSNSHPINYRMEDVTTPSAIPQDPFQRTHGNLEMVMEASSAKNCFQKHRPDLSRSSSVEILWEGNKSTTAEETKEETPVKQLLQKSFSEELCDKEVEAITGKAEYVQQHFDLTDSPVEEFAASLSEDDSPRNEPHLHEPAPAHQVQIAPPVDENNNSIAQSDEVSSSSANETPSRAENIVDIEPQAEQVSTDSMTSPKTTVIQENHSKVICTCAAETQLEANGTAMTTEAQPVPQHAQEAAFVNQNVTSSSVQGEHSPEPTSSDSTSTTSSQPIQSRSPSDVSTGHNDPSQESVKVISCFEHVEGISMPVVQSTEEVQEAVQPTPKWLPKKLRMRFEYEANLRAANQPETSTATSPDSLDEAKPPETIGMVLLNESSRQAGSAAVEDFAADREFLKEFFIPLGSFNDEKDIPFFFPDEKNCGSSTENFSVEKLYPLPNFVEEQLTPTTPPSDKLTAPAIPHPVVEDYELEEGEIEVEEGEIVDSDEEEEI